MDKKIFYIRRSNKGLGAILSSRHPRTVIVYAQSPYATRKQTRGLETTGPASHDFNHDSTVVLSGLPVFPRWQRNADRRLYDAKRWQLEGE